MNDALIINKSLGIPLKLETTNIRLTSHWSRFLKGYGLSETAQFCRYEEKFHEKIHPIFFRLY
jgi:hypothetical protein